MTAIFGKGWVEKKECIEIRWYKCIAREKLASFSHFTLGRTLTVFRLIIGLSIQV